MSSIIHCRGIFYEFGCSGKEYKEAFNFQVQIEDTTKSVKELKKAIRYVLFGMIIFLKFCSLAYPSSLNSYLDALFSYFQSKTNKSIA